jgi:hypothetical protein
MRRSLAALMAGVVLVAMVEPFAAAASLAATPRCCRRDGKHHCMPVPRVRRPLPESSSPALNNVPQQCPMRRCVRSNVSAHFTLASRALEWVPAAFSRAPVHDSLIFTASGFSSHTDRGPPPLQA